AGPVDLVVELIDSLKLSAPLLIPPRDPLLLRPGPLQLRDFPVKLLRLRPAAQNQGGFIIKIGIDPVAEDGEGMGAQAAVDDRRREAAAAVLADDPAGKAGDEDPVDRRFPMSQPIGGDIGPERPGHLHGKPDSVESGRQRRLDESAYLERFLFGVEIARLAPLRPAPEEERVPPRLPVDVDPSLFQRAGRLLDGMVIRDVDASLSGGEPLLEKR